MKFSTYSRTYGPNCWLLSVLPTIWLDKSLTHIKPYTLGRPCNGHELKVTVCWLFWSVSLAIEWPRRLAREVTA